MTLPLHDVRVIEVDNWMAAPSAGAIFADLGADVVKVEPLSGDPMRDMGRRPKVDDERVRGHDLQFDVDNRGKRSIAVALDTPEGAELVQRLCRDADVFLCNLLPHRQERFGLDPARLLGANPRIVHATLTGYGSGGPDSWRPGYDVTAFFGRSGLYDAMREGDDGLVPQARPAQGDHTTGLALVGAILAALRLAERTGEGQVVETSLYETAVWTQASDYAIAAVDRAPLRRRTRHEQILISANRFPCGDGHWITLNNMDPADFGRMCAAMGMEHLLVDDRFTTQKDRFENMRELVGLFDERFVQRGRDEWGAIFDDHRLVWAPILEVHEVASDEQADAIDLFPTIEHDDVGPYRTVRIPMRFGGDAIVPRSPAPRLAEHTRAILHELGVEDLEVDRLLDAGVIGAGDVSSG